MTERLDLFRRTYTDVVSASGTVDIASDRVGDREQWRLWHVICRSRDSAPARITLLIQDGEEEYPLCDEPNPQANRYYWWVTESYLPEGNRLIARFQGVVVGDRLEFHFAYIGLR